MALDVVGIVLDVTPLQKCVLLLGKCLRNGKLGWLSPSSRKGTRGCLTKTGGSHSASFLGRYLCYGPYVQAVSQTSDSGVIGFSSW